MVFKIFKNDHILRYIIYEFLKKVSVELDRPVWAPVGKDPLCPVPCSYYLYPSYTATPVQEGILTTANGPAQSWHTSIPPPLQASRLQTAGLYGCGSSRGLQHTKCNQVPNLVEMISLSVGIIKLSDHADHGRNLLLAELLTWLFILTDRVDSYWPVVTNSICK